MTIQEGEQQFLDDTIDDVQRAVRAMGRIDPDEADTDCREVARMLRESATDMDTLAGHWHQRVIIDRDDPDLDDEEDEDDEVGA